MLSKTGRAALPGPAAALAAAVLAFAAALLATPTRPLGQPATGKPPPAPAAPAAAPRFEDRTLDYGISFVHQQGEEALAALDETLGAGACALDFDNDGWVDLFLVNGSGQTRYYGKPHWWQGRGGHALLRNVAGRRFEDAGPASGLAGPEGGMGCVSADFDGDGDADLLVTGLGGNRLYRNDGGGRFQDATAGSGIAGTQWSTSAAVADFDKDGRPDLYVANYVNFAKGAHTYEAGAQFSGGTPAAFQGALYDPQPNLLYRNLGGLKFEDATAALNAGNGEGRTLGAAWGDVNRDGWPDLLLANDKGAASSTALLNGRGQGFAAAPPAYGMNSSLGHHGVALGDIDNDGRADAVFSSDRGGAPLILLAGGDGGRPYADRARDLGVDSERFAGLAGWAAGLRDFDNDGRLDLFIANGLLAPDQDAARVPLGQPKQLWMNLGPGGFADASGLAGEALADAQSARGAAFADFDNDGDIDVYVAHNNDLGQLLINQAPPGNHWLGLALEGAGGDTQAIGAEVRVETEEGAQTRTVAAGGGFLSDNDRRLHFGLGRAAAARRVEIRWPDGSATALGGLPAGRYYRVRQGGGAEPLPAPPAAPPRPGLAVGENDPANRIAYLRLAAAALGPGDALAELEAGALDGEPAVRAAVADWLGGHPAPPAMGVLARLLSDTDPGVAAKAARALCAYEDESAVRWMLRALRSPHEEALAALAGCFGYLYREEEAVIHRKYLALPGLIRLLRDGRPGVRAAAARALADAERYRAAQPLEELLGDPDQAVRAEAARALGLVREGRAIPALLAALETPGQAAAVYAHALIALKRLALPGFAEVQRGFVEGEGRFAAVAAELRLGALREALERKDDGVVLDQDGLGGLAAGWAGRALPELLRADGAAAARELAAVLGLAPGPAGPGILQSLARHADPQVRAAVYPALLRADPEKSGRHAALGLADPAEAVRLAVLRAVAEGAPARGLPPAALLRALDEPGCPPELAEAALRAAAAAPDGPEPTAALLAHPDARVRAAALAAWAARQPPALGQLPAPLAAALADGDEAVQRAACRALLGRPDAWAAREAEARLAAPGTGPALRACLLEGRGLAWDSAAARQLARLALSRHDGGRALWLPALLAAGGPAADPLAWQILGDEGEWPRIRMAAAESLAGRHGAEAVERLRGRGGPPNTH